MAKGNDIAKSALWRLMAPALSMLLVIGGCGTLVGNPEEEDDGDGKGGNNARTGSAPVTFAITDAPIDEATGVFITVASLAVSTDGTAWTEIPLVKPTEFNLMDFHDGEAMELAKVEALPAGVYTGTRFILAETPAPRITLKDGTTQDLEIPSAERSGIKIGDGFTVTEGEPVRMTIDFDLRKSVRRTGSGKYMMRPVLRMVSDKDEHEVSGSTVAGEVVCLYKRGSAPDASNTCDNAVATARVRDGKFKVAFVPPGEYDLRFFPASGAPFDVSDVRVNRGRNVDLGRDDDDSDDRESDRESDRDGGKDGAGKDKAQSYGGKGGDKDD